MRAVVMDRIGGPLEVREVPDPAPAAGGVVVRVRATGLCRSDWHAWAGHDDIALPHVPGHELAGTVAAVGAGVTGWAEGDRVTVPFVEGCGRCEWCASGNAQVCPDQEQPGFTHWGSFAEYVALHAADTNLVAVPAAVPFDAAASLGCRFATAYRALTARARLAAGEWVTVVGAGGVGLSSVMIARALGARVIAVDRNPGALDAAKALGAEYVLVSGGFEGSGGCSGAAGGSGVPGRVHEITGGAATWPSTRSAASRPPRTRSCPCAAAAAMCRWGCSRRLTATRGSRWPAPSPGSSTCSAAMAWPPRTIRGCSPSSSPVTCVPRT